jgi:hypothetical protein
VQSDKITLTLPFVFNIWFGILPLANCMPSRPTRVLRHYRQTTDWILRPQINAKYCLTRRQPIMGVACPRVAANVVVDNASSGDSAHFQPASLLKITHCHWLHYIIYTLCIGEVMSARSTALLDTLSWRCILGSRISSLTEVTQYPR